MTRNFLGLMMAFIIGGAVAYPIARYQMRERWYKRPVSESRQCTPV